MCLYYKTKCFMSIINKTFCFILSIGDNMDYRKRLYDLRIDNDLRQEDVAKILRISSQAYGLYENGKRGLPIDHLITLCKFYNVTSDYLLALSDKKERLF